MAIRGLMAPGVPPQPKWLIFIKGAIILLAVIVLALAAYALSLFGDYSYYYSAGAPGYLLFVTIFSMIVYGTAIFLELKADQFYYRIAMLAVYILTCIFWLSSWAWAASWAAFLLAYYNGSYYPGFHSFGSAMAACAALGAVTWVLCIINLVFFIVGSVRNHDSAANPGNVELGHSGQKPAEAGHTPGYAQNQTAQPTPVQSQQAY